ncbi:hypothetical protein O3G_MSEX006989 [Manduca sexta]|uniref:CFA20 domain-containing protein n=1 Tax=Manduca sexta TaxID=7130 RepID=A0A922CLB7_MANSE|nr:hypothetical protein O3G_MSEX006989 [Manduca sexta]
MQDGYISRFLDQDIKSMVLEIRGNNVSTTYMICPKGHTVLGITMPFLVMIVKNLKKYFSFEVTILDETNTRRRFRVSNFQSNTQIQPLCTVMPIGLSDGWNQIQFNLAEFTRRAYKKQFVEVQKLKINANIRLRRIYFTEKLIPEDQLPPEYKLYFPLPSKSPKNKKSITEQGNKENVKPSTSQQTEKRPEKVGSKVDAITQSSKTSLHTIKKYTSPSGKRSEEKVEKVASSGAPTAALVSEGQGEQTNIEKVEEVTAEQSEEPHGTEATPSEPATTEPDTADTSTRGTEVDDQPTEQPAKQTAEQPAE